MSKQTMFKIVYLVPEYLMLYLVLAKFFHGVELAVYCGTIFYMYFILGYLYTRKINQVLTVVLMALPIIVGMFIPANDPIRFVVQLVIMILSVIRMLFFYRSKTFFTYNRNRYMIDSMIFIAIALIIGGSVLIYYILLLRLLLLMMMNSTTDIYGKAEKSDIVFMLINCAFVFLLPIAMKAGYYLTMFFTYLDKHNAAYYVILYITYPFTYLFYAIGSLFTHGKIKPHQPNLNMGNGKGNMNSLNQKEKMLHVNLNTNVQYIFFVILIIAAILVIIGLYMSLRDIGKRKDEKNEFIQDEIDIPKVNRKAPLKNLPSYRAMYVKILMLSTKKGFELKNSTTARQFKEFLRHNTNEIEAADGLNNMYEKIRYGNSKIDQSLYNNNADLVYNDIKKQ